MEYYLVEDDFEGAFDNCDLYYQIGGRWVECVDLEKAEELFNNDCLYIGIQKYF